MFYGRQKELHTLRAQLRSNNRTAVLVYGKRRVGKSTLITEAAQDFDGTVVNHLCAKSTYAGNVALLCRSVSQAFGLPSFTVPTIFDVFDFLKAQNRQVLIILDEYQYFKDSLKKGELDSYMQAIVDSLPPNIKLILCGSYITVMKELLEKDNPLFGRFSAIIHLTEMDYLDAARFYPNLSPNEKIARYAVFGGSPYVLALLDQDAPLDDEIRRLLVTPNSIMRTHIESIMLAEIRRAFDIRILQVIGNGQKRYSDISSSLGGDGNGLLDKQLKSLIDMETIEKTTPINRRQDKRKTFYSIKDNLMRFYFCFLFANESLIGLIGEDAFFDSNIDAGLPPFISLRFEGIVQQYFSRLARAGKLSGIQDIGSYWFDDPINHVNGQFDCVIRHHDQYDFFEAIYYRSPMCLAECRHEEAQVRAIPGINVAELGFVCSAGFSFTESPYQLITGEDLYTLSEGLTQ